MNISGLAPTVLDAVNRCTHLPYKHLLELVELQETVQQGGQNTPPEISFDEPIVIAGRKIFRPTYAIFRFIDRMSDYIKDEALIDLATFWALEHGRNAESLQDFHSNYEKILLDYTEQMTITRDEIAEAIDAAFDGFPVKIQSLSDMYKEEEDSKQREDDILATVSSLVEAYGKDFNYWIYDFNIQAIVWLSSINAQRNQDPEKPSPDSLSIIAECNFMNRRNQLWLEFGNKEDPMVKKLIEQYGDK